MRMFYYFAKESIAEAFHSVTATMFQAPSSGQYPDASLTKWLDVGIVSSERVATA